MLRDSVRQATHKETRMSAVEAHQRYNPKPADSTPGTSLSYWEAGDAADLGNTNVCGILDYLAAVFQGEGRT